MRACGDCRCPKRYVAEVKVKPITEGTRVQVETMRKVQLFRRIIRVYAVDAQGVVCVS